MTCKIVTVIRSTNLSKILNNAITVKLHCNYTVNYLLHYVNVVFELYVCLHVKLAFLRKYVHTHTQRVKKLLKLNCSKTKCLCVKNPRPPVLLNQALSTVLCYSLLYI